MNESSTAIRADGISIRYGRRTAVEDVTVKVDRGSVYALLGRNGAGKSSFVRAVLGQVLPAHGSVLLLGEEVWRNRTRLMDRIGVVPEEADAPPEMKVRDLGWFSSRLYSRWSQSAFDERIDRFAISRVTRFGDLSKGQKKQVHLALALAISPELVLMDDPTLGLDVVARKSLFEEVIAEMADRGTTVMITTHDLASIEAIADRVGIMDQGRMVLDEQVDTLKARFRRIRISSQPLALASANFITAAVRQWGSGTEAVVSNYDDLTVERLRDEANVQIADIVPMSLEDIFIAMTGDTREETR